MEADVRKMKMVVWKQPIQPNTSDVKMEPDVIKEPRNVTKTLFTYLKIEKEY
jgi:hypothetical protein